MLWLQPDCGTSGINPLFMTYLEAIKYLESFVNFEKIPSWNYKKSFKLERVKDFLYTIDNPQSKLKCIHIAGSKGKGSTCAFIANILREAGFKVGLYTSPHLSDFRERIRILKPAKRINASKADQEFSGMISQRDLVRIIGNLIPKISKYNCISKYGILSFFEIYTSIAFVYFKEKNVDYVVLETGLGGRLDATNAANSIVCAITPISLEHTQKLGNTIKEIAFEKAGIIKTKNQVVISAPQVKDAARVIRCKSNRVGATLFEVGKDITYKRTRQGFKVVGILGEYLDLKTTLIGEHQLINATVALGLAEALHVSDISCIKRGIYNTVWPGRCEIVSKVPLTILDGAQNSASALALKKTIRNDFIKGKSGLKFAKPNKVILVLGVSKDKDIKGVCRDLYGLANKVILTKSDNPRACAPEVLAAYFRNKDCFITTNVKDAKRKALELATVDDLILVTGSLFVVGEYRNA